jgi:phosphatidylethanolamine-binding protein (PEBP) family uncharacterized protein
VERLSSSWSHHVVAELPPSQDKEEEDKDKEEEEEDEEKEEEAIVALALQHAQRAATSVQSPCRQGMCCPKSPTRHQPHPTLTLADIASNKTRKPDYSTTPFEAQ